MGSTSCHPPMLYLRPEDKEAGPGAYSQPWPTTLSLHTPIRRAPSSAPCAPMPKGPSPGALRPAPGWHCGDGRLSCLFSSVLCTHTTSTFPGPWGQELFTTSHQARF